MVIGEEFTDPRFEALVQIGGSGTQAKESTEANIFLINALKPISLNPSLGDDRFYITEVEKSFLCSSEARAVYR